MNFRNLKEDDMPKKKLFSFIRIITWLSFLPFIVLVFYNRPSADDLFLHYDVHKRSIIEVYRYMYTELSSRYTSLLVLFTLVYFKSILQYYSVVPMLMLGFTYFGIFFSLTQINRFILFKKFGSLNLHVISLLFLLLFLVVMPEPSSGFYWLSGAITHQLPIVLLLFFSGFYLKIRHSETDSLANKIIGAVFLFLAVGCNEMVALYLGMMFLLSVIYLKVEINCFFSYTLVLFLIVVLGNFALFAGGGQQNRAGYFNVNSSFMYALSASYLKYSLVFKSLFTTPFFWFCMLGLLFLGKRNFRKPVFSFPIKWWLAYFIGLAPVFYFFVYLVNPSGVPDRANNPVAFILLVSISAMVCHISYFIPGKLQIPLTKYTINLIGIYFVLSLFFSSNYLIALENQISGPVYSYIFDKRLSDIQAAKKQGRNLVRLDTYTQDWNEFIQANIPSTFHKPMIKLVNPYPQTIFFCDDISDPNWITSYAEFYDIDTVQVENKNYLRFTLDKKAQERNNGFR